MSPTTPSVHGAERREHLREPGGPRHGEDEPALRARLGRRRVPHYRLVTDAVHAEGGRIFSQLTHGGHTTALRPPDVLWAPTQLPEPSDVWSTKAMDLADLHAVVQDSQAPRATP